MESPPPIENQPQENPPPAVSLEHGSPKGSVDLDPTAAPTPASAGSDLPTTSQPVESRTREYLSNERTYLSWMRTAISLMGIGVILGRIHAARPPLAPNPSRTWQLGIIFAVVGLITVFLSTQHYLAIRREISDDSDEITERWVIVFSIAVLLIGSGILYYVLA
ncbi:DUF202 domain-containing protein [Leptolyngbya sp. NK1-12]|uniref:DUF202 domain-containing protein n=1 Tax=Leptolyngbya sp. NK1-12 TaxID=2547451 RepID=A0AA97AJT2_9CYAN|nr:DUF202 domain-containing protein [Leptolyngbya sp. NK1-12]WNZ26984.1 DUF202 domain-containing protein [Leptolyngbya sp. NK1-12]